MHILYTYKLVLAPELTESYEMYKTVLGSVPSPWRWHCHAEKSLSKAAIMSHVLQVYLSVLGWYTKSKYCTVIVEWRKMKPTYQFCGQHRNVHNPCTSCWSIQRSTQTVKVSQQAVFFFSRIQNLTASHTCDTFRRRNLIACSSEKLICA
jgi:hypothetical protein